MLGTRDWGNNAPAATFGQALAKDKGGVFHAAARYFWPAPGVLSMDRAGAHAGNFLRNPVMATIAFLGAGLLGSACAEAAAKRGEKVTVWNRSPDKAHALSQYGIAVAATPADAVRGAVGGGGLENFALPGFHYPACGSRRQGFDTRRRAPGDIRSAQGRSRRNDRQARVSG
jgi:hypothetical protein